MLFHACDNLVALKSWALGALLRKDWSLEANPFVGVDEGTLIKDFSLYKISSVSFSCDPVPHPQPSNPPTVKGRIIIIPSELHWL